MNYIFIAIALFIIIYEWRSRHKPKVNYQSYIHSREWQQKSRKYRGIMFNRCSVFPFLKSGSTHHMTYSNLGREVLLRDCVPLSNTTHYYIVHPIARLFHKKHDIHSVRFFVNWLLLRPLFLFWFILLSFLKLWSKLIGRKLVAAIAITLAGIFGYALWQPTFLLPGYQWFYAIGCYVSLVCYSVFEY